MKSSIKALMEGEKTVQQIVRDHIACITCVNDPEPDENTTIDPELIQTIIESLKKYGGMGRWPAWYDSETNTIQAGINFRKP